MMTNADRIAGYNVLAVLGHGANSTIYAVQRPRDGQVFALKRVIKKDSSDQRFVDQVSNEYRTATRVDHHAVRKCFKLRKKGFLITSEVLLLMEFVDGRNLIQHRPSTIKELINVFMIVADGLAAMHKAATIHADIKPNNIVLTENGEVKIIDLGQSCPIGTAKQRIQGTPDYIAPEQVQRRALTVHTDIFNLGATMYWCVTDNHAPTLIPKTEQQVTLKRDMSLQSPRQINNDVPPALDKLILECLQDKPDDRPQSMKEVYDRLVVARHQLERK